MRYLLLVTFVMLGLGAGQVWAKEHKPKAPVPFVMQMTTEDPLLQRRALMQIQKVLADIGSEKVRI